MNRQQQQISVPPQQQQFALQIQKEVGRSVQAMQQGRFEEAVTGLQRTLQRLKPDFPGYDLVTLNLLVACKQRIEQLLAAGDHPGTTPFIRIVLGLQLRGQMVNDREFRNAFADSFHGLGNAYFDQFQFEAAAMCFRKALSIELCPTYHNNLGEYRKNLFAGEIIMNSTNRVFSCA